MLPVAGLLAAAGMIVGVFSLTGLGLKVSSLIMSLSGGNPLAALFLAMVASFLVGLSLPITATYIMTVVMVAPALVKVGLPMHVAHMLAFYFAVLSEVSPPVGLSPSAAAAVTGGNPFKSMMQAWKYSLPAFLVPFLFSASKEGASPADRGHEPAGASCSPASTAAPACSSCRSGSWDTCEQIQYSGARRPDRGGVHHDLRPHRFLPFGSGAHAGGLAAGGLARPPEPAAPGRRRGPREHPTTPNPIHEEIDMQKRLALVAVLGLLCLTVALPSASAQQKLSFSIVTGGTGGVWYPLGGAIGGVIGKNVPNTDATAEVTTAAIDNLKLLAAGQGGDGLRLRLSHASGRTTARSPSSRRSSPCGSSWASTSSPCTS